MQIVINLNEDVYTRLFDNGVPTSLADGIVIERAIRTGTPIPDNATNGDVLEIMFSKVNFYVGDWWNAPYQKGGKVE